MTTGAIVRWPLAALLTILGAPAATAAPPLPTIAHQLYLYGNGSGYVRMRLTAPIAVTPTPLRVVRWGNPGALVGALIVREEAAATPSGIGVLYAWTRGFQPRQVPFAFGSAGGPKGVLQPGTYRVYLLTRGTERTHGIFLLSGAPGGIPERRYVTVPANAPTADSFADSPGAPPNTPVSPLFTHASAHPIARRGLLLNAAWWVASETAPYAVSRCTYGGTVPDGGPAPVCPDDRGTVSTMGAVRWGDGSTSSSAYRYVAPARWTQKVAFAVGDAPKHAGVALVWVDLGPGFPAAPPAA